MSGRGKSSKKNPRMLRGKHVSVGSIRRLARRGGVRRISALIYEETRQILVAFLRRVVSNSIIYAESSNRLTIQAEDVVRALRSHGRTIYGFDEPSNVNVGRSSIKMSDANVCSSQSSSTTPVYETRTFQQKKTAERLNRSEGLSERSDKPSNRVSSKDTGPSASTSSTLKSGSSSIYKNTGKSPNSFEVLPKRVNAKHFNIEPIESTDSSQSSSDTSPHKRSSSKEKNSGNKPDNIDDQPKKTNEIHYNRIRIQSTGSSQNSSDTSFRIGSSKENNTGNRSDYCNDQLKKTNKNPLNRVPSKGKDPSPSTSGTSTLKGSSSIDKKNEKSSNSFEVLSKRKDEKHFNIEPIESVGSSDMSPRNRSNSKEKTAGNRPNYIKDQPKRTNETHYNRIRIESTSSSQDSSDTSFLKLGSSKEDIGNRPDYCDDQLRQTFKKPFNRAPIESTDSSQISSEKSSNPKEINAEKRPYFEDDQPESAINARGSVSTASALHSDLSDGTNEEWTRSRPSKARKTFPSNRLHVESKK